MQKSYEMKEVQVFTEFSFLFFVLEKIINAGIVGVAIKRLARISISRVSKEFFMEFS